MSATAKQFALGQARATAEKIVEALGPFCSRIEVAGSIRRGRTFVGDIDIVVLPKDAPARDGIERRAAQNAARLKGGDQYVVFALANGLQLDLWFAHGFWPQEVNMFGDTVKPASPANFGMLLLARTGSAMHNVHLAKVAQARGMHFDPHAGLKQAGKVIASEEEADVFKALGIAYVEPERREA